MRATRASSTAATSRSCQGAEPRRRSPVPGAASQRPSARQLAIALAGRQSRSAGKRCTAARNASRPAIHADVGRMSRRTTHSTTTDTGSRAGKRLTLARLHANRTAIKPSPPRRLTAQFAGGHYLENAGARGDASPGPCMTARGMVVWFGHEVRSGNQGRPDRDTPARQARTDHRRRARRSLDAGGNRSRIVAEGCSALP